jgi:hypothetical protein
MHSTGYVPILSAPKPTPLHVAGSSKPDFTLSPVELAKLMVESVLGSKALDCGDRDGKINHEAEELGAAFYSAYHRLRRDDYPAMYAEDLPIFHLCHGLARIIVNACEGRVLWDKVVDTGGWATVAADAFRRAKEARKLD